MAIVVDEETKEEVTPYDRATFFNEDLLGMEGYINDHAEVTLMATQVIQFEGFVAVEVQVTFNSPQYQRSMDFVYKTIVELANDHDQRPSNYWTAYKNQYIQFVFV